MKNGMRDQLTALLALNNQSTSLKSFVTELCICFKGGASYHILKKHYRLGMWINKWIINFDFMLTFNLF